MEKLYHGVKLVPSNTTTTSFHDLNNNMLQFKHSTIASVKELNLARFDRQN